MIATPGVCSFRSPTNLRSALGEFRLQAGSGVPWSGTNSCNLRSGVLFTSQCAVRLVSATHSRALWTFDDYNHLTTQRPNLDSTVGYQGLTLSTPAAAIPVNGPGRARGHGRDNGSSIFSIFTSSVACWNEAHTSKRHEHGLFHHAAIEKELESRNGRSYQPV